MLGEPAPDAVRLTLLQRVIPAVDQDGTLLADGLGQRNTFLLGTA